MEAPTQLIQFQKESDKGAKYSIEIKALNEYIKIFINSNDTIPSSLYEKKIYLSDVKTNRYLSICANIQELFLTLQPQLKLIEQLKLKEKKNALDLLIPLPSPLIKEVIFSIQKIEKDLSMEVKDLYKIINQQQDLINKLNDRITILEKKEKEREEKEKEKEEERQYFICKNSKIIENEKDKDLAIRRWINPNKKDFKFKLLFRMSRDGNQSTQYHKLCDGKDNLLTIIQTDNGKKFGGFASKSWGVKGNIIDNTFMFSLNSMKKFERLNNEKAMHDGRNYGPVFGNAWDIYINPTMTTGKQQYNNYSVFLQKYEFNNEATFNVIEIEVFHIK